MPVSQPMDAHLNTPCRHCLTYCHAHILQGELQSFVRSWNSHPIHKNHLTRVPSGVPEDLYYLPHRQGRILTVLDHPFAVMHNSISGSFTMIPHTHRHSKLSVWCWPMCLACSLLFSQNTSGICGCSLCCSKEVIWNWTECCNHWHNLRCVHFLGWWDGTVAFFPHSSYLVTYFYQVDRLSMHFPYGCSVFYYVMFCSIWHIHALQALLSFNFNWFPSLQYNDMTWFHFNNRLQVAQ